MKWHNSTEMAFDIILGDRFLTWETFDNMFDKTFTQIGMACSCHASFGKICIVELG